MSAIGRFAGRVSTVAGATARATLRRAAPGGVVLCYHDVVARDADGLSVTAEALRRHVRLIRRFGLAIVPLEVITHAVLAGRSTDGMAALTFDDGLVGVHEHAVDVLADEDAPATLCAVSGAWGQRPAWWPGARRVMTKIEATEVLAAGWDLQAHTHTHRSLPTLADAELATELRTCRAELEDFAGQATTVLAYPDGHHDLRVRAATQAAGFVAGFTFLNGRLTGRENVFRLPRLGMTAGHTPLRLAYHLARSARSWPDHQLASVLGGET